MVKPEAACQIKGVVKLLHRVAAADGRQHTVVQRLRVDADAGNPRRTDGPQLILRHRIRPAGLHRKLPHGGAVKAALRRGQHRRHLLRRQRRRRTAAHIHRLQPERQLPRNPRRLLDFPLQQLDIGRNQPRRALGRMRDKGAVIAARRAERHRQIQTERFRPGQCQNGVFVMQRFRRQCPLAVADEQTVAKIGQGRLLAALPRQAAQQLDRTHAGQHAPALGIPEQLDKQLIQQCGERQLTRIVKLRLRQRHRPLPPAVKPRKRQRHRNLRTLRRAGNGGHRRNALLLTRQLIHRLNLFLRQKQTADILRLKMKIVSEQA